jgi:hypothetical protein
MLGWFYLFKTRDNNTKEDRQKKQRIRRIVIYLLVLLCGVLVEPRVGDFVDMLFPAGIWFIALSVLSGCILSRCFGIYRESELASLNKSPISQAVNKRKRAFKSVTDGTLLPTDHRLRIWVCLITVCFIYFFSISIFALGIYPFIPASKGGGDFTYVETVYLRGSQETAKKFPDVFRYHKANNTYASKPLVLIEATDKVLFLANPWERGGADKWKRSRMNLPTIIEVPRSDIEIVHYR